MPEPTVIPGETRVSAEAGADRRRMAAAERQLLPARVAGPLAETFRVLGDVTRVRLLDALSTGELCVCDLAALLGLSESAVSHQLRLLRNLRIVRPRRVGRQVFYTLDDQHIVRLFEQGLRHVEETGPRADPPERGRPGRVPVDRRDVVRAGRAGGGA